MPSVDFYKKQIDYYNKTVFLYLEDSKVMSSIYNSDTLEKLLSTVHKMQNKTTWNEKLFVGKLNNWYQ